MDRGSSSITDFPVAPRRPRTAPAEPAQKPEVAQEPEKVVANEPATEAKAEAPVTANSQPPVSSRSSVILPTPEARQERAANKALEREASRLRLQELKQNRARESKHFVNCPLDYDTKKRLERAASENDVKMTVIVKAAIDQFLRDNGY